MMYDPSAYIVSTATPIVRCHWHGTASPYSSALWEIHHDGSYDLIPMSLSKAPSPEFLQTETVVIGSASVQGPARAQNGRMGQHFVAHRVSLATPKHVANCRGLQTVLHLLHSFFCFPTSPVNQHSLRGEKNLFFFK